MRKNYVKTFFLFAVLMLASGVSAVNIGNKTKAVYSYGAMSEGGYSHTPTGVVRSYYDINNRLARVVEADIMLADNDLTLEVEYPGQEVPRLYSIYDYNENGQLVKVRTRKYGLYSGHDKAWAGFVDAETYEYDENGNLVKKTDGTYITTYVWEEGKLVEETAYYVKDNAWSSTIKYTSFSEDEVNTPLTALFSDKWKNAFYYEYGYDAQGNKVSFSQYKVIDAVKNDAGVLVEGKKGKLNNWTTWTYVDNVLTEEQNGYSQITKDNEGQEVVERIPQSKVVYTINGDTTSVSNFQYSNGKWVIFGSTKKHVTGVVDNVTSPLDMQAEKVANATNTVLLTATAPAGAEAGGWNVYRNAMLIGEAALVDGKLSYQDTLVFNGTWDYFIQKGDDNTSAIVDVVFNTPLPAVEGVSILKNSLATTGDYEVAFAWVKPNTTLPILGYNVYADIQSYETNPLPKNGTVLIPVEVAKDTLTWLISDVELLRTLCVEVVYNIGKVKSEQIPVVLQKEEIPLQTKVIMTMGDAMGTASDNSATKAEVYYYDNANKLARKMIYGKLTGDDPDDPDQIYRAGDWIPMTYTAYDYNEKGQLVYTRERQYGVFSGYNKAWNEFEETGSFSYDELGRILEDTMTNRVYHYKYEGDNIVQETYANSRDIIIYHKYYSNFVEGLVNCPQYAFANSPYGLTTNDRIYEYSYDEKGRMITCYTYKYNQETVEKDDDGNIIHAEKGTPEFEEFWTYENDILVKYEKNEWKNNKGAFQPKTRTEYILTPMGTKAVTYSYSVGIWARGGTPQVTWDVPFKGNSISNLTVTDVAGKVNTVKLNAEVPAGYANNTVWNVFRNGVKIGQAQLKRGELTYTDESVPNGYWDYFIQEEDSHTAMGVNVSNVVEKNIYTELPPVTNIRVVSNGLNDVRDYEVKLEWDAPQTDLTLKGYNMFVDVIELTKNPSPVNYIYPFEETSYVYTAATDVNPNKTFMVEAVYNIGKIKSEAIAVKLSKEILNGIEDVVVSTLVVMVENTLIVNGDYSALEIYSLDGKSAGNYSGVKSIDLNALNAGVYVIRLHTEQGWLTGKIWVK